jgi:hypothetical protein
MDLALTDATGSGADLVPVAIRPVASPRRDEAAAPAPCRVPHAPKDVEICEMYVRGL